MLPETGPALADRARRSPMRADRPARRAHCRLEVLELRTLLAGLVPGVPEADSGSVSAELRGLASPTAPAPAAWQVAEVAAPAVQGPAMAYAEIDAPHESFSSAQSLPMASTVEIIGRLDPDEQMDMYRVPMTGATFALRLGMWMESSPVASPLRAWMFDASGRVLGSWPVLSTPMGLVMRPTGAATPAAADVYIGLSPERSGDHSTEADSYRLQVQRLDRPESGRPLPELPSLPELTGTPAGTEGSAPAASPLTPVSVGAGTAPLSVLVAAPAPVTTRPRFVASGPLPLLSAAPYGGVLSPADPTMLVDRGDSMQVELALHQLADDGPVPDGDRTADPDERRLLAAENRPPLVPSFDPVLLLGPSFDLVSRMVPAPPEMQDDVVPPPAAAPPASQAPTASGAKPIAPDDRPQTVWRRLSVRAGLAVAAALAIGLLLPDLGVCRPYLTIRRPSCLPGRSRRIPRLGHP